MCNSESLVPVRVATRYLVQVTVKDNRLSNLLHLIEMENTALGSKNGGIATVAEKSGLSEKYISQIKNGFQSGKDRTPRGLGNRASAQIEAAYSKRGQVGHGRSPGWMDRPPGADIVQTGSIPMIRVTTLGTGWPFDDQLANFHELDDRAKSDLADLVRDFIARHAPRKRGRSNGR